MPLHKVAEAEICFGAPSPSRAALACSRANCFQHGSFNQVPNPSPDKRALDVFPWFTWSPPYYYFCCPVLVNDRISAENYLAGWTPLFPAYLLSLHHFKKHMRIFSYLSSASFPAPLDNVASAILISFLTLYLPPDPTLLSPGSLQAASWPT